MQPSRCLSSSSEWSTTEGDSTLQNQVLMVPHAVCRLILLFGSKYIPIEASRIDDATCDKAFLNVMASSSTEKDAIVCCKYDEATLLGLCPQLASP